ncbi:MAG TPA: 30S ribosomal protein S12 methylthiotransferase RimO [Candidatus Luteococcus avicola]|nr:30S ribosomal protein S12 methylthiotransferase RimO [Candidatus Luteococcus avicola]
MSDTTTQTHLTSVHLVSLGCARNETDSEELAARLEAGGFRLVDEPDQADAVMVNTCGFIEQAKKDSVDTLMAAADLKEDGKVKAVVAVGCMAERYGQELAETMPEADAVLGFDQYADISERLNAILHGQKVISHVPRDRRTLLPVSPVKRHEAAVSVSVPGHHTELPAGIAPASGPPVLRRRLDHSPSAPLKLASGCDRRCAFCAIPSFRGSYLSRPIDEVVAEAQWLVTQGVKEAFLVSENSSSYGKDMGDLRLLEKLLGELATVDGLDWVRVSYLQPAEMRPSLIDAMVGTDKVVPYFDLSFQHASGPLLRRMRRFGDADSFLALLDQVRAAAPQAGIRSNVIVGFPGETEQDVQVLKDFLMAARLDVTGVFGYSDEEGTEAATLDGHLDEDEVEARRQEVTDLVTELCDQRAEERVGDMVRVLVDSVAGGEVVGRAAHQGPEVDGCTTLIGSHAAVGDFVDAVVTHSDGVDLVARA